jgi:Protein of unknown function (DUF1496)
MIMRGRAFVHAMTSSRSSTAAFVTAAIVLGSVCFAADGPSATSSTIPSAAVQASNPAPYLQAILGQLVEMHHELDQTRAMAYLANTCKYEAREYTEGAIVKVGNVALVCVSSTRLITPGTIKAKRDDEAERQKTIDEQGRRCIWEPLNSPRVDRYRKLVGLRTAIR